MTLHGSFFFSSTLKPHHLHEGVRVRVKMVSTGKGGGGGGGGGIYSTQTSTKENRAEQDGDGIEGLGDATPLRIGGTAPSLHNVMTWRRRWV